MKKLFLWLLVAVVLLSGVVPALAAPVTALNDLSRYFPQDTVVWFSSQLDDAFFSRIDSLVARFVAALPPEADVQVPTIIDALDSTMASGGISFSADIRPWLGDTVAFGVLDIGEAARASLGPRSSTATLRSNMGDPIMALAVAIKDRAAATDFLVKAIQENGSTVERSDQADYTVLSPPNNDQAKVIIRDDVMLLTNDPGLMSGRLPSATLADSPAFNETYTQLPVDDYFMGLYLNLPTLKEIVDTALAGTPEYDMVKNLFEALGPQVWGLTLLDDSSLTLDLAQIADVGGLLQTLGMSSDLKPIDPSFARFIPADSALVSFGNNLKLAFDNAMAQANLEANITGSKSSANTVAQDMQQFEATLTELTGLDLNDDILSWMTGDYAYFIGLNPELDLSNRFGMMQHFPADFGVVIQATDPAAAAKVVDGVMKGLDRLLTTAAAGNQDFTVSFETATIGGTDVHVVTLTSSQIPWPVELLIGSNQDVLFVGTRAAITTILLQDGTLLNAPVFSRAQSYVLGDYFSQTYFHPASLLGLADLLMAMNSSGQDQAQMDSTNGLLVTVLNFVESITTSVQLNPEGGINGRLSINLAQ